ncbi:MAG: 3-dehydroquinate synthase, partial [Chitinophagaceae bacterium]|nr:3-dehydroquinate synthase [Chitinophagaceae bacterium]
MEHLHQSFSVNFEYKVFFTKAMFDRENKLFENFLKERTEPGVLQKIIFVIDSGVQKGNPALIQHITSYFKPVSFIKLVNDFIIIPGGEEAKNNEAYISRIIDAVNSHGIDRHSYVAAIGGGSILDLAGYVSAISHRGIKHIRIPTTVLSQNDSGVGVKNGVNYLGKKNF